MKARTRNKGALTVVILATKVLFVRNVHRYSTKIQCIKQCKKKLPQCLPECFSGVREVQDVVGRQQSVHG